MIARVDGDLCHLGVGINVNEQFSVDDIEANKEGAPRSLKQLLESEKDIPRESLLASLCNHLEELSCRTLWKNVLEEYRSMDRLVGRDIVLMPKMRENPLREIVKAIGHSSMGMLRVREKETGKEKVVSCEDVSVRLCDMTDIKNAILLDTTSTAEVLCGVWRNTIGSTIVLHCEENVGNMAKMGESSGRVIGSFRTAVSATAVEHPLFGAYTQAKDGGAVLGFSVAWDHMEHPAMGKSVTSWSGRLYRNYDGGR